MKIPSNKFLLLLVVMSLAAPAASAAAPVSAGQWDEETLRLFAEIPILDGGRVKPLDTYAAFTLLKLNGKRFYVVNDANGDRIGKLTPMEWLLDCLFYPEVANEYKSIRVDDSEILRSIGVTPTDDRQDYYSYTELALGRETLLKFAMQYSEIESNKRTPSQVHILNLWSNLSTFESVTHYLDFTRKTVNAGDSALLSRIFPDMSIVLVAEVTQNLKEFALALQALQVAVAEEEDPTKYEHEQHVLNDISSKFDMVVNRGTGLALIPPADPSNRDWRTPSAVVWEALELTQYDIKELEVLGALERLGGSAGNEILFKQELRNYHSLVVAQTQARSEYAKVPMEISFYKAKFFFYAQWLFVLSFVVVSLSWLNLPNKLLARVATVTVSVPLVLLVAGITYRCILRSRPPVSTLYETILFITATAVLVALCMEYFNRQRIALSIASILGVSGMFLANKFELSNGTDTMPSLVAVLDTNFWLSTHVTTIVIGYAAGLLAAAIAHIYIFGKLFGFKKNDAKFYQTVTRMVYGIVCFGLLFSFIGTVLGGIWANYSWGRFWGWDPKENGAALIVLCNLAILHARMGGYIRQLGMHMAAIFTGGVVAFSWWGVNELGVGLHAYGFTDGVWGALMTFWYLEGIVILLGAAVFFRGQFHKAIEKRAKELQTTGT